MLLCIALLGAFSAYGQVEVKVNPLGLLFGSYNVIAEVPASETFGIEGKVGFFNRDNDLGIVEYQYSAFNVEAAGKFYFNPREGFDRFYVGPYAKFNTGNWEEQIDGERLEIGSTRLSIGLLVGHKWVADSGFIFELGLGAGRAIVNEIDDTDLDDLLFDLDLTGRLAIGYRF